MKTLLTVSANLFIEIKSLIIEARTRVAQSANTELVMLNWHIGTQINEEVLHHKRAEYGKQIIQEISLKLTNEFGSGWSVKQLRHCLRCAETFSKAQIVSALQRQLNWNYQFYTVDPALIQNIQLGQQLVPQIPLNITS